ncbi:flagellar hook-associated protein 2 [Natronocella acetinitrilica]|uniref:Flagellar hook-associated protein 2 n=1 Tax=Natronocella acetinitrilica TaxID=414046 RepID=A0AAE3G6G0_9GAMM|nr:flagellar filament capping protein FliD [Natronocella acetinitrilica]MCP1675611.1 flagellar hook-associated protein 2 [Natronocella acetinitrilica]
MTGISSLGVGSGIDIRGLVDQLVAAERAPQQNRIDRQAERFQTQLSALGQVRSALSSFQTQVRDLAQQNSFLSTRATSSNEGAIAVTARDGADAGNFDIQVNRLAQAQSIATGAFASRDAVLGSGSLTFRFGAVEQDESGAVTGFSQNADKATRTIQIDPANNTLQGIRDAVNGADIGVRANIVNDGSGERLVFSSTESGEDNGFLIDVDSADAALNRLAFNESSTETIITRSASNAELTIDGLAVTRSSNTITDLIDGVTLDLRQTTETAARIQVETDNSGAREAIEGFVAAFNELQGKLRELTRFNPETETAGPLNGNAAVRNITSQLRNALTAPLAALEGREVRAMADIGILTTREGGLELNADRLESALERDPDAVAALFGRTGIVDGGGFSFDSSRTATENGRYGVNVSELASRGRFSGAGIGGGPISIAEGDNTFRILVDGTRSEVLTLRPGDYDSPNAVARELQALINGSSVLRDGNRSVSVSFDIETNSFTVTSQRYGSESSIAFNSVAAGLSASLGIDGGVATAGTDVQGTIGGVAAEGFGQFLTGQSGPTNGLKLKVDGGQTGDLGSITYSRGIMSDLDRILQDFIGANGSISNQTNSLNSQLSRLDSDQERLDRRMSQVESRYVAQFSAMDQMVAQMNETSQFLSQQLATLNFNNNNNRR